MSLFRRKYKHDDENKVVKGQRQSYNLSELEQKVRTKTPMTVDEFDALQRERIRDVMNRILRVFGVCAMLFVIVLAVGAFLYPYSLFNLFGEGDKFWDCWNHIQYHLPKDDIIKIYGGETEAAKHIDSNGVWGWANVADMMQVAFQGTSPKLNFLVLGAWSVVLVATIGIIAAIIFAAYITAYNIRDLIIVIRHFGKRGAAVISDVAVTAAESVETGAGVQSKKKNSKKQPTVKKKTGEKDLFSDDDDIAVKGTKPEDEPPVESKPEARRTEGTSEISSEDLDRLLSGEDIRR